MSAAEEIARRWFEEVWNQSSPAAIDRLMAPGMNVHGLPESPAPGPAGFKQIYHQFKGAFPDLHIEVKRTVVEGPSVVALCRVTGTHTGGGLGEPTNKRIDFWGLVLLDTAADKLQEGWNFFDFPSMYRQIGRAPDGGP